MVSLISSHYFERSKLSRLLGKIVMIMVHEQSVYLAMVFMAKVNTIIDNPRTQAKLIMDNALPGFSLLA